MLDALPRLNAKSRTRTTTRTRTIWLRLRRSVIFSHFGQMPLLLARLLRPPGKLGSYPAFRRDQRLTERPDFVVNFARIRNCAPDFLPKKGGVSFPEPVHPSFYRAEADAESFGHFVVSGGSVTGLSADKWPQYFEAHLLAGRNTFLTQTIYGPSQQNYRPTCIVDFLWRQLVGRLELIPRFGVGSVKKHEFPAATAFERMSPISLVI